MDKKLYFEPEMEVVELELQGMLASSITEEVIDNAAGDTDNTGGSSDDSGLGD